MLTNHTVSLDLSLRMREAGWKQEGSLFYWHKHKRTNKWIVSAISLSHYQYADKVAAISAGELMERIPMKEIYILKDKNELFFCRWDRTMYAAEDKSLPNALAKLWLHMKAEKII